MRGAPRVGFVGGEKSVGPPYPRPERHLQQPRGQITVRVVWISRTDLRGR
ncbi:hypothetical protein [Micromonospora inositola]|nr:hypothetical protein [Micromonospora inositola]